MGKDPPHRGHKDKNENTDNFFDMNAAKKLLERILCVLFFFSVFSVAKKGL
jgi:hypothetical protein